MIASAPSLRQRNEEGSKSWCNALTGPESNPSILLYRVVPCSPANQGVQPRLRLGTSDIGHDLSDGNEADCQCQVTTD